MRSSTGQWFEVKRALSAPLPLWTVLATGVLTFALGCGETETGPGLTASVDRFHDRADASATFELSIDTTEYTALGTPYGVEMVEGDTVLGSIEVVVVDGSSGNPDLVFWQVAGQRGTEVAGPGSSPIEKLSAETITLEAAGAGVERMLSDLETNEEQSRERVDVLLEENNTWELELASLDDRLAESDISLVQLGEFQKRARDKLDELGLQLNEAISELQKWERWRTGTVHTAETAEFDNFVRQYLSLVVRSE